MTTIALLNLKGGTGKTTSAMFVAYTLHEQGYRVLFVDADPQASAMDWHEDAPVPFRIIALPSKTLHSQLPDFAAGFDYVVLDTPPLEQQSGIVVSALRVADVVIVPTKANSMEVKRLGRVKEVVDDAAGFRPDGKPVPMWVMVSRVNLAANSTGIWTDWMVDNGYNVLKSPATNIELYAQAESTQLVNASASAYGDAISELRNRGVMK